MNPFSSRAHRQLAAVFAIVVTAACSDGTQAPPSAHEDDSSRPSAHEDDSSRSSIVVIALGDTADPFTASAVAGARTTARTMHATLEVVHTAPDRLEDDTENALKAEPSLIIGVGAATVDAIDPAAASNLDQQFLVIGGEAPEPTENLTAVVFRSHEALYLSGIEAGLVTTTGTVGVVAPAPDPLVDAWVDTFVAGARRSGATVQTARVDGPDTRAAISQLERGGADVLQDVLLGPLQLESTSGGQVFAEGARGCGTDGTTDSVVTHVDRALDATAREILSGRTGGVHSYGLAEEGITLASLDGDQACLIAQDPAALDRVRAERDAIVAGTTAVPDPDFATPS